MRYGVLKGRINAFRRDDDTDPHSELLMIARDEKNRIAINVRSSRGPTAQRLVEFVLLDNVRHPVIDHVRSLKDGWTELHGNQGVDFIRNNMFRATDMRPLVHTHPGPDNDLFEKVEALAKHAMTSGAMVYVYGQKWGPEPARADQYFGFLPGNGVHRVHMNQGDRQTKNAKYQDGALFVDYSDGRTSGLFIKFQNQVWHTDEQNGDPIKGPFNATPISVSPTEEIEPWAVVPESSPYHLARIVGALVNAEGIDTGKEKVTIFNTSGSVIHLKGWKILDVQDREEPLSGSIPPGEALTLVLQGDGALLGNDGGTITLLDPRGLKVDGVAYSKKDAQREGRPLVF